MTDTTCGNLQSMPASLRRRRISFPGFGLGFGRRLERAVWLTLGLACTGLMAPACGGGAPAREPVPNPSAPEAPEAPEPAKDAKAPIDDDAAADRYLAIKAQLEADPAVTKGPEFPALRAELESIANGAAAKPLRANAALLLGSMFDERGDPRKAAGFYQHAASLIPDDAGPYMALAVANAAAKDYAAAAKAQEQAATLDPDNLENWLALGELRMRAGDQAGGAQAYVAYELRRKGLIDGLTLHDAEGTPVISAEDRIACAEALAAAADQGTGYALIYALRRETDPTVRATVARVMGIQRLDMYLSALQTQAAQEGDAETKEAVAWALAEIARDPVKIEPTERPRLAEDDPRATEGELPRADAPPVELTDHNTLAPAGAATGGAATPSGGPAKPPAGAGGAPAGAGEAPAGKAAPPPSR
jgi:tetratricopeptide (TPR) repeat protein